ncbi:hypothetical protein NKG94_49165 [Micromonospora sp. M12]
MAGRTVAAGYWQRPDETEAVFGGQLADGRGRYLRTGDLGARLGGRTYVTGRRKDVIIIRASTTTPGPRTHRRRRAPGRRHRPGGRLRRRDRRRGTARPGR